MFNRVGRYINLQWTKSVKIVILNDFYIVITTLYLYLKNNIVNHSSNKVLF